MDCVGKNNIFEIKWIIENLPHLIIIFFVHTEKVNKLSSQVKPKASNLAELYFARPHLRFSGALFCPIAALRKQLHSLAMRLFSCLAIEQNSLAIKAANMTARSINIHCNGLFGFTSFSYHETLKMTCVAINNITFQKVNSRQ